MIDGTVAAYVTAMRFTDIPSLDLVNVTGGCGKKCCPPPQPPPQEAAPPPPRRPSVDVTVATGAAGGQAIQQALQQ